jgi:hypothetical protein
MKKAFSAPRGTVDILPDQMAFWRSSKDSARSLLAVVTVIKRSARLIFEETRAVRAFSRRDLGYCSEADAESGCAVYGHQRQMHRRVVTSLSLRPEGTASIVRAYIEHRSGPERGRCRSCFISARCSEASGRRKDGCGSSTRLGWRRSGVSSASPYPRRGGDQPLYGAMLDARWVSRSAH